MERLQEDFCLLTERKQSPATEGACIVGSLRRKLRQLRGPRWHRHCDVIRAATCTHPGSKGDVELFWRTRVKSTDHSDHYSIFFSFLSKNVHLPGLHSFFYSSMPVSKHRDFDNLINQWMDIILFLDRYETKIYDYYKFIFLFFLPSITFHNKNPISYHNIYSSSNINCRWKNEHSNQFKQSSSQIKIMSSF